MKVSHLCLAFTLPLIISSCTLDKAEMNRRGLANMQKAKQRHLDRIAKEQGRPASNYNTSSTTYAQRAEQARLEGIRERNRVRVINKNSYREKTYR